MRAVNSQWRSLLLNPFSQFHTQRKIQAFTNPSLFLLAISYDGPPNRVECTEIDLLSHKKSKTTFTNDSVREMIFLEGHACISHGALVIVLGGFRHHGALDAEPSYRASKSVHIFNTITKKWTLGAEMLDPRGEFAWGFIGNHLYVAGGFGGDNVGNLVAAEVYDFEANEWRVVSSMPVSMTIDVFFVVSGKLFVRGWLRERNAVEAYSYCPLTNVWEEDNWLLRVLEPVPRLTSNKFAVPGDEKGIYMVEMSEPFAVWGSMTERLYLSISRLDNETLEWVRVYQILDKAQSDFCECPDILTRQVPFHGLKDGVVVLCHHHTDSFSYSYSYSYSDSESESESDNDQREVEVSSVYDSIVKVSVPCPSEWSCAVVNA